MLDIDVFFDERCKDRDGAVKWCTVFIFYVKIYLVRDCLHGKCT